jgi:replicative DNA helicase
MTEARGSPIRADEQLEQLILGTWISDEQFRQAWKPEPDLFFFGPHRDIASVFEDAFPAKRWNETYTIGELQKRGRLHLIGHAERVLEILGGPVLPNPLAEVDRLRELRALRNLRKCVVEVDGYIAAGERLSQVQERMRGALEQSIAGVGLPLVTGRELMSQLGDDLSERSPLSFCSTGWRELDSRTGAMRSGWVWLWGADTSWGKTAVCAQIVDINLHFGKRVLIVTTEDPIRAYRDRLLCRRAGVSFTRLRDRKLDRYDVGAMTHHAGKLEDGLFFLDGSGVPVETLEGQIRAACAAHKIHLVIVDYIHATETEREFRDRSQEIRFIGRRFTSAIKRSRAAGLMFAQLTMQEGRPNKEWVRDCKDLVKAAETVIIGYEDKSFTKFVSVEKAKFGRKGMTIEVGWNNRTANFKDDVGRDGLELDLYDEDAA